MTNPQRGVFITVEGVEGAGKSTNIDFIRAHLEAAGVDFMTTREPGGTPLAEEIRELLLAPRDEAFDGTAELLLIFAARAQHLEHCIRPALEAGQWVLCDRFTDATYAYQGAGRELGRDKVAVLENLVQGELRPDITFFLDLPVAEGMARATGRGELDRFEREETSFFDRVRNAYLELIAEQPERYRVIDASRPLEAVQAGIAAELDRLVEQVGQ